MIDESLHPSPRRVVELTQDGFAKMVGTASKKQIDMRRLDAMSVDEIDRAFARAKYFSEALKVLGVGRKTFIEWLDKNPQHKQAIGWRRAIPLWLE